MAKLLEHLGALEKIAKVNIIELKKGPGIGAKKARGIYRAFY